MTENRKSWIVVAVDGSAASGKGTISKRLAEELNLVHLDTGKLYRALTYYLIKKRRKRLFSKDRDVFLDYLNRNRPPDSDLQSEFISRHTPEVAGQQWARNLLLDVQREFARNVVSGKNGAVLDGRDIGTVVVPNADVKIYIDASIDARAIRRRKQLLAAGEVVSLEKVRSDLEARDRRDIQRSNSPLKRSSDALLLDTTELSIEAAVQKAILAVRTKQHGFIA